MSQLKLTLLCFLLCTTLQGQVYEDYLGAGHDAEISVTTSSNYSTAVGENTINGIGMDAKKMEAARFLSQATFGGNISEVNALSQELDFEGWIDAQFNEPINLMLPTLWDVDTRSRELFENENPGQEYFGPFSIHFQYAWWDQNFKAPDQLRQRVAYALSQIVVISLRSQLGDFGEGLASYYDILLRNSFGNYEDLLQEISIDPNMAFFLSHLNNPKTDTILGIRPDENYAREIMQLFSIGLYELNNNGTRKVDGGGNWIPTYDNNDIRELAKVFTGLKGGAWSREALMYVDPDDPIEFGVDIYGISREVPLQMDASQHEPGPKTIVGDFLLPGNQSGMEEIQAAVNHIFNHPNVGPFIARRLIQNLVKSNPTPAYINRVANAFNDNGSGVRGDMKAIIKAILLDEEARGCAAMGDPDHGKIVEPVLRYTQIMHGLPSFSADGYYWNNGFDYYESVKQAPLSAPSVFNFYLPDHQPVGDFSTQGLFAPEMQIHNSSTGIGYMNQVHKWADWRILFWDWHSSTPDVEVDLEPLFPLAYDPEGLINHFDVLLTHGRLSEETRATIRDAISQIPTSWDNWEFWRTQLTLYLFMISPDYVVLK